MDINRAIDLAGGVARVAQHFGIHHSAICRWRERGQIPAARVPDLARLTGIPRHQLRPDLWEAPPAAKAPR